MKPLLDRLVEALAPRLAYRYIRLLRSTMRFESHNSEILEAVHAEHGQFIMVFWHSRFLLMRYAYPFEKIAVLASSHRDSEMLGRVIVRLGAVRVLGSSTRGGVAGMREILRRMREGMNLAITPDGPRGPRRRVKAGVLATSRLSGKPILPVAFGASRGRRIGSWDQMLVPYPFSRGVYVYGEPMFVPRQADEAEIERLRFELEDRLDGLTDEADRKAGYPIESPRPEPQA